MVKFQENKKYNVIKSMRHLLKPFAILLAKFVQRRYRKLTEKSLRGNQSNVNLNNLRFLQSIEHWLRGHLEPWGYFHPSCVTNNEEKNFIKQLFPLKDFEEVNTVVWEHPKAITWYHNKLYRYGYLGSYSKEIKKQIADWENEVAEKLPKERHSGRSTRLTDDCVQKLYQNGEVTIKDHFGTPNADRYLLGKVVDRMRCEHRRDSEQMIIKDFDGSIRLTLNKKRGKGRNKR